MSHRRPSAIQRVSYCELVLARVVHRSVADGYRPGRRCRHRCLRTDLPHHHSAWRRCGQSGCRSAYRRSSLWARHAAVQGARVVAPLKVAVARRRKIRSPHSDSVGSARPTNSLSIRPHSPIRSVLCSKPELVQVVGRLLLVAELAHHRRARAAIGVMARRALLLCECSMRPASDVATRCRRAPCRCTRRQLCSLAACEISTLLFGTNEMHAHPHALIDSLVDGGGADRSRTTRGTRYASLTHRARRLIWSDLHCMRGPLAACWTRAGGESLGDAACEGSFIRYPSPDPSCGRSIDGEML